MEESMENCCRICLDVESKHVSILEDSLIQLQIKSCLPISVAPNDNLPKSICEACVLQLNDFYNFQLNARCSQDWLESSVQKTLKNSSEKPIVQPLPDSEYNSDSLLEFLNNTANIEEYLNNLGKEDIIPCIVNMLDKAEPCDVSKISNNKLKLPSPKKKNMCNTEQANMDIDVLDSDKAIVKELLLKEPKKLKSDKPLICFGCKIKFENIQKLSQHLSTCDIAFRTCLNCNKLFDSKIKMKQHLVTHTKQTKTDQVTLMGYAYSCKQCGDTVDNHFELYKHAKKHVTKADERICDICGHKFIGDEALSKHRKTVHEKPEKVLYRCKICCFTSEDRKQIYSHVSRHTQVREPNRHLCESCGQSFATQATLLRHSQQHGTTLHKCKVCKKIFTNDKFYDRHLLEHAEMIMCEKCGQNFTNLAMENHVCH